MTCPGLVQAAGDDVVSWQTAFWSIVPIAMNSMLQNNGMVLSFPSDYGMALRSSPIFCLFDAMEMTLTWLLFSLLNAESPVLAAKRVARRRFSDVPDDQNGQSLLSLSKQFWIFQVVFIVSVLTQAIKLFGMQGIAGTQICAAFYLWSWLISQAMIFAAGNGSHQQLPAIHSAFLTNLESHGLPFRSQFRILAVLIHCFWIEGCLLIMQRLEGGTGVSSHPILLVSLQIVIGGLMPFILYHSDLTHLIHVTTDQFWSFRICILLAAAIPTAWNKFVDSAIVRYPFRDWAYLEYSMLSGGGIMGLATFTHSTRDELFDVIFTTYAPVIVVLSLMPDQPIDGRYVFLFLTSAGTCGLMGFLMIPNRWLLWIRSKFGGSVPRPALLPKKDHILLVLILAAMILYTLLGYHSTLDSMAFFSCVSLYTFLMMLKRISGTNETLFSPMVAGTTFVVMNGLTTLLWYWQFWPKYWPDCTVKPAWTSIPFG